MKPAPFTYHRPETLGTAIDLLSCLDEVRILAGGQSLVPMLNLRIAQPAHIVDIGRIPELQGVRDLGDDIGIGSMTTQRDIERSVLVSRACPILVEALLHVGHQQTRNRGTIGGSLCHMDPSAELVLACAILEPTLDIAGPRGVRQLPFSELSAGYLTTSLAPDEILTRITIRKQKLQSGWAFQEYARRHGDFAACSVAVLLEISGGLVHDIRVAVAGAGPAPLRLKEAEEFASGRPWNKLTRKRVIDCVAALSFDGDPVNPSTYRRSLAIALTDRALTAAEVRLGGVGL